MPFCVCGCGRMAKNRFVHGHNRANRGVNSNVPIKVDHQDEDLLRVTWSRVQHTETGTIYARRCEYRLESGKRTQRTVSLHRIVAARMVSRELLPGEQVDHINGDGLDNRRANLRVATPAINSQNRRPRPNPRGVTFHKATGKWRARAGVNRKMHQLGTFDTQEEAARVAHQWRLRNMPGYIPEGTCA